VSGPWPQRAGEPERLPCGCLVYRVQRSGEVAFVIEPCSLTCAEWDKPARFQERVA